MLIDYELGVLEHLFSVVLNPTKLTPESLTDEFLSENKLLAKTEKERIRNQFTLMAFSECHKERIEMYFGQKQSTLVRLSDIIFKYRQPKMPESIYQLTTDNRILKFYEEISIIPEMLLNYIEMNFPLYFDREIKAPDVKLWRMTAEIKRNLKLIQKEFRENKVHDELIKITCSTFEDYFLDETKISFHELSYLKELQHELIYFTGFNKHENSSEQICNLLLQMNFNSIRFFNYYILQLEEMAKGCKTITEQIEFYSLKNKLINQLPVKPGLSLNYKLPSIRDQIGNWICEELYFLEKRQVLLYQAPLQKNEEQIKEQKVHTSLSVAHLSMAVKLLIDAKIFTNKNSTELMKMVARNFKTDRREHISEDSLRNKSYNFETATVDTIKDLIIELLNLARKY